MQVTTLITLPEEVYRYFRNAARTIDGCTVEQLTSDVLTDYVREFAEPTLEEQN